MLQFKGKFHVRVFISYNILVEKCAFNILKRVTKSVISNWYGKKRNKTNPIKFNAKHTIEVPSPNSHRLMDEVEINKIFP